MEGTRERKYRKGECDRREGGRKGRKGGMEGKRGGETPPSLEANQRLWFETMAHIAQQQTVGIVNKTISYQI